MFVRVDRRKCLSNGQCAYAAPGTFHLSETGELGVSATSVQSDTDTQLEHAARLCPTAAIALDRDAPPTEHSEREIS